MKTLLFPVMLLAGASAALADERVTEDFRHTFTVINGKLDVSSFNGSVEVMGADNQTVEITGTKYGATRDDLNKLKVEVVQEGTTIRARSVKPEGWKCNNCGAKFVIRVPRRMELTGIRTSNGSIHIENIEGVVDAKTSNGGIRLAQIKGKVDARTSNGGVQVDAITGALTVSTSNGSIKGRVIDTVSADPVKLSTSNGSIEMRIEAQHNNDITASTSNGSVTIRMPEMANARIQASTSSHESITTDLPVTVRGTIAKNKLEGTLGSGSGPLVTVTTSNGAIRLLRL